MRVLPTLAVAAFLLLTAICVVTLGTFDNGQVSAGTVPAGSVNPLDCTTYEPTPTVSATPTPGPPWTPVTEKLICNDTGLAVSDLHVQIAKPAVNLSAIQVNAPGCPDPSYIYGSPYPPAYLTVNVDWTTPCVDPGEYVYVYFIVDCVTPTPGCSVPSVVCFYWTLSGQPVASESPAPNPPTCASPTTTPAPTLTPCGFSPPSTHTPSPTEFDAGISLQFTNGTGKAASDLHICLSTGVGGTYAVMNAPDCATPAVSHQTRGRDIDVIWPSACVDAGETFIIGVWAPGSAGVQCSYWTLDGQPLEAPCGPTPTPWSPTPTQPASPTIPCPAGPHPSGGCLPCPTYAAYAAAYARGAVVLSTCPPIVTPTATPTPSPTPFVDIQGDSNCSGSVDATDALAVLRINAGLTVVLPPPCEGFDGDVDCNLVTNAVDALKILRHNAQLSVVQNEPCPDIGTPE